MAQEKDGPVVVPVVEEQVRIDKRTVTTGVVRLHKRVRSESVPIDEPLREEHLEIERVPVDRIVDKPPEPYLDGDVWVWPVVEEVLVVERKLRVREEVRVRRSVRKRRETRSVDRRIESVDVERPSITHDPHDD